VIERICLPRNSLISQLVQWRAKSSTVKSHTNEPPVALTRSCAWTDRARYKDSNMAAAMTMHPPSIRPPSISLAISPTGITRFNSCPVPADSQTYGLADNSQNEARGNQCDGCRRRSSRCAMNLASNKCYSCDFHRQDCVFTPHTSRKRSYPQPMVAAGKKRYAPRFSSAAATH